MAAQNDRTGKAKPEADSKPKPAADPKAQPEADSKAKPAADSKATTKVKPLDREPATQRPYDPGYRRPDDGPEDDPWIDTGEPEVNG